MMQLVSIGLLFVFSMAANTDYSKTNQALVNGTSSQNVTIENYEQVIWLANISIGYPNQYFTVQIDTGSNILWVTQSNCRFCPISNRYNTTGQGSYSPNGSTYYAYYGSGEASGPVANDTVALVGSVVNDTFAMMFATYETGFTDPTVLQGIMGISNNQTYENIFQAAYKNKQISTELYGLVLNQQPLTSYLIFGDIDQTLLNQAIWVTCCDIYRWRLSINNISANGVDLTSYISGTQTAILDSGTTEFVVTAELYAVLLDQYFNPAGCEYDSGEIICPCAGNDYMPNITVVFNQANVTIPFINLIQYYYTSDATDYCQVLLGYEEGNSFMIFGDPIFLSIVPLFNKTSNQIGIIGGVANNIPNGNYTGDDEIDEAY